MFIIRGGRRVPFLLDGDAGGGGGSGPGEDFDAVMDGIAEGYKGGEGAGATGAASAEGAGAEPAVAIPSEPGTPPAPRFPDPEQVTDDVPYRDAARLRDEMARARDRYKPIEETFGTLPDEDRETLLSALPNLHPEDRTALIQAMGDLTSDDPEKAREAADYFAAVADHLRELAEPDTSAAERDPALAEGDPLDQPMTRREFMAEQERMAQEQETQRQYEGILEEARDLGYDPTSTDLGKVADFTALCEIASRTGGDLEKAHKVLEDRKQAVIDEFLASKTADASRVQAPTGGASSTEERTLDTLDDGEAAMRARIEATLGPRS